MKSSQKDFDLNATVAELQQLLPVYRIGMSVADFQDRFNRLSGDQMWRVTDLLYSLYRHFDVANEPFAYEKDLD